MRKKKWIILFALLGLGYFAVDVLIWIVYAPHKYKYDILLTSAKAASIQYLPENVYIAYEEIYPGSLEATIVPDVVWILQSDEDACYPLIQLARSFHVPDKITAVMIANEMEYSIDNKKALALYFSKTDFTHNQRGIDNAAVFYYKKSLHKLTHNECLELIVMSKNPSFYNKFTNPVQLEKAVQRILNKSPH